MCEEFQFVNHTFTLHYFLVEVVRLYVPLEKKIHIQIIWTKNKRILSAF